MKAIVIASYGGPELLTHTDQPDPVAGPGEVVVRVAAAGVNPIDTYERAGLTKEYRPLQFPAVLGWDVAGTVASVGPGVQGFAVGENVMAWAYRTYAGLCAIKADLLTKVPDGLDLVAAAALPLVTLTGSQLVSAASGAKAGQTVLVSGALGSVGRSAVYMAKERGAVVIAGVLTRQAEAAKGLGADQVVALDDDQALGGLPSVDVVANTVRGATAERLLAKVKAGGVFASVTGAPANAKDYPSVQTIAFVSKQDATALRALAEAVAAGKLTIPVDRILPLKDAREAHAAVEKGGSGKIVLVP